MKVLNIICSLILIATLIFFGVYNYHVYQTSDKEGPVIQMEEDLIEVSVKDDIKSLLEGVTAFDQKDGDVTNTIGIESITEFLDDESTTRQINYVAFDQDTHVAKAHRRLVYTDYTPIHFSLTAPLRFPEQVSNVNILGNICAKDCIDGDISKQIGFSEDSSIQVDTAGNYRVTLCVTNSAGDTQELPITVRIYNYNLENSLPQIILSDYLIYTKIGEKLNPYDYLESVTYRGVEYTLTNQEGTFGIDTSDMTKEEKEEFHQREAEVNADRFIINDMTDYSTPGSYEISYAIDSLDGERGYIHLVVVVE